MGQKNRHAPLFDACLEIAELPEELRLAEVEIGRSVAGNISSPRSACRAQMDQDEWDDAALAEGADRFVYC